MSTGSLASSSDYAEIFFTTNGSTPAAVSGNGYPPGPDSTPVATASDMVYAMGLTSTCYGADTTFWGNPFVQPNRICYCHQRHDHQGNRGDPQQQHRRFNHTAR